jgi:DnaJ homolog subfamily C member 19
MKFVIFIVAAVILYWLFRNSFPARRGMPVSEAAKLLGVEADADAETIIAAHKKLIAKVHPDAGGSAELASRVNLARDTLLKHLPKI